MLAISAASWRESQAESAKRGGVGFPDTTTPPYVALRGNPPRADRERVTTKAVKFSRP